VDDVCASESKAILDLAKSVEVVPVARSEGKQWESRGEVHAADAAAQTEKNYDDDVATLQERLSGGRVGSCGLTAECWGRSWRRRGS
jgi:hypothetical protein